MLFAATDGRRRLRSGGGVFFGYSLLLLDLGTSAPPPFRRRIVAWALPPSASTPFSSHPVLSFWSRSAAPSSSGNGGGLGCNDSVPSLLRRRTRWDGATGRPFGRGGLRPSSHSAMSASVANNDGSPTVLEIPPSERLREAYVQGETDGVLSVAPSILSCSHSPEEIVSMAIDAAKHDGGKVVSMLNALIGACCPRPHAEEEPDRKGNPGLAWGLLNSLDEISGSTGIYPDVVTLCLAYTALSKAAEFDGDDGDDVGGREEYYSNLAESVLDRARRASKKAGGSKRRKELAALSRKQSQCVRVADCEDELREMYGPEFRVLHETDGFVALSKPSGMVCFHKRKTTAGKIPKKHRKKSNVGKRADISLEDALSSVGCPLSTLNSEGRGIVHRLDRGTSGCIVIAKNDDVHAKLVAEFFLRGVKKSYSVLIPARRNDSDDVQLHESLPQSGDINLPVGGRPAKSHYKIVGMHGNNEGALTAKVETYTGRRHQVRIHCAEGLGRPIFLDALYGSPTGKGRKPGEKKKGRVAYRIRPDESWDQKLPNPIARVAAEPGEQERFFLHASSLSIESLGVQIDAPLPPWWEDAVLELDSGIVSALE